MRLMALLMTCAVMPSTLWAEGSVSVETLEVDGLAVRSLTCTLEETGLFVLVGVLGALSPEKQALDACAPEGAAFRVRWTWAEGATRDVEVESSSAGERDACIVEIVARSLPTVDGQCEAVLLVGDRAAAEVAADALP